jgi:hypothetical protein
MDHVAVHGLQAVLFLWINLTGSVLSGHIADRFIWWKRRPLAPKEKGGGPKTASLCMRPGSEPRWGNSVRA